VNVDLTTRWRGVEHRLKESFLSRVPDYQSPEARETQLLQLLRLTSEVCKVDIQLLQLRGVMREELDPASTVPVERHPKRHQRRKLGCSDPTAHEKAFNVEVQQ
jgi:hypothetical protein